MTLCTTGTNWLSIVGAQRNSTGLCQFVGQNRFNAQHHDELRLPRRTATFDGSCHGQPAAIPIARIVERDELDLQLTGTIEGAMGVP